MLGTIDNENSLCILKSIKSPSFNYIKLMLCEISDKIVEKQK